MSAGRGRLHPALSADRASLVCGRCGGFLGMIETVPRPGLTSDTAFPAGAYIYLDDEWALDYEDSHDWHRIKRRPSPRRIVLDGIGPANGWLLYRGDERLRCPACQSLQRLDREALHLAPALPGGSAPAARWHSHLVARVTRDPLG